MKISDKIGNEIMILTALKIICILLKPFLNILC